MVDSNIPANIEIGLQHAPNRAPTLVPSWILRLDQQRGGTLRKAILAGQVGSAA